MLARTREALIKARADVNAANAKGCTPMDLANKASSWAVYKILEEAGGHLASLKPRYLVHCHGGDLKWVLIRAEDLECHSRAGGQTMLASNCLM